MVAAQMPAAPKRVPKVRKTNVGPHKGCPGFLGRYRELVEDGEDARGLMIAMVRAKVAEHAARKGVEPMAVKARAGAYCNSVSLTRDTHWAQNIAAARVSLRKATGATAKRAYPAHIDGKPLSDDDRRVYDNWRSSGLMYAEGRVMDERAAREQDR
jgi:hypothetical protein